MNTFLNVNRTNGKSGLHEILKSAKLLQLNENEFLPFLIIQNRKSDAEGGGKGLKFQILPLGFATDYLSYHSKVIPAPRSPSPFWRIEIPLTSEEGRSECKSSFPTL